MSIGNNIRGYKVKWRYIPYGGIWSEYRPDIMPIYGGNYVVYDKKNHEVGINKIVSSMAIPLVNIDKGAETIEIVYGGIYNGDSVEIPVQFTVKKYGSTWEIKYSAVKVNDVTIRTGGSVCYLRGLTETPEFLYMTLGKSKEDGELTDSMYHGFTNEKKGGYTLIYIDIFNYFKPLVPYITDISYGFPYTNGESETGDSGQGDMTDTNNPITLEDSPQLSSGGLFAIWKMTKSNLSELSAWLNTSGVEAVGKLFTEPMDYLLNLKALRYSGFLATSKSMKIGNGNPEINASELNSFNATIDCGSVNIPHYFKTFMDYSPYTKMHLYLPYVGIIDISPDSFIGDRVSIKYRIDAVTGDCVAIVSNSKGIVSISNGNCSYNLPLRARDYNEALFKFGAGLASATTGAFTANPLLIAGGLAGVASSAVAVNKPNITNSGSIGGNVASLINRKPYLIIERPKISVPSGYGKYIGYQAMITKKLGSLSGFTKVTSIRLDNLPITDTEKAELERILKEGIIL